MNGDFYQFLVFMGDECFLRKFVIDFILGDSRKYPYNTTDGFSEFRGQGGVLWTRNPKEWGHTYDWNSDHEGMGIFRSGISRGNRQVRVCSLKMLILWTFKISLQIKHELTTLLTTAEAGYKTSINRSDMCSCSFTKENRQNLGCTSSSRGLNVDEFLIRLIKYEKSMFLTACTFLVLPSHEQRKLTPVPRF